MKGNGKTMIDSTYLVDLRVRTQNSIYYITFLCEMVTDFEVKSTEVLGMK